MDGKYYICLLIIGILINYGTTERSGDCNRVRCRRICPGSMFQADDNGCILCRCCTSPGPNCINTRPHTSLKDLLRLNKG
ncbi:antistasin-like [Mytilus galloprovincialis]|uniref:antistasin-like n=1 Tax=Mytilus galloprovincialis TaxID=29158 RepID=UPI003F7C2D93